MGSFSFFALIAYSDFGRGPIVPNPLTGTVFDSARHLGGSRDPYTSARLKKARFEWNILYKTRHIRFTAFVVVFVR